MTKQNFCTIVCFSVMLFFMCGCGGGGGVGKGLTIPEDIASVAGDKIIEGYIYSPSDAARMLKEKNVESGNSRYSALSLDADISSYIPFASATVTATCGKTTKSTTTDSTGYYKVEKLPSGTCKVSAKKGGTETPEQEVEIDKDEEEATGISWTTDNRLLGRAMFEDGDKHNGITVTIKQGDYEKQTNTNAEGIYVFPAASQLDDGEVYITANNDCEYFLPSSISITLKSGKPFLRDVEKLILLKMYKYTVTADTNNIFEGPIKACLNFEYRGNEEKSIWCPYDIPDTHILNLRTNQVSDGPSTHTNMPTIISVAPNYHQTYCRNNITISEGIELNVEYALYMTLCDSELPACAGTYKQVMKPVIINSFTE